MTERRFLLSPVLITALFLLYSCAAKDTVARDDYESLLFLGVANNATSVAAQHELNGFWKSFTGNATSSNTIRVISATNRSGVYSGVTQTDSSGFGGFSSCSWVVYFDNVSNVMITQNPILNGACFTGDTNAAKFFKEVWIDGPTAGTYWTCTLNGTGVATVDAALAIENTSTSTNPGTTGCGGFAWSRIEPRT